jgi:hypothetical protein
MLQRKWCVYFPPFVIFKGVRFRDIYKQDLPAGCEVAMTDSVKINEDIFLEWLQHFQKHRSPGKCPLILDGHASHSFLKCLDYFRDNGIEMLCLPPHTTHVLQPLDRTVFKPIKTCYHQAEKNFLHNNPNAVITKFQFGKHFSEAWNKGATVGNAAKGFECTGMFPLKPSAIPDDKFLPSQYFKQDSTDSLSPDTLEEFPVSSPETPKPL